MSADNFSHTCSKALLSFTRRIALKLLTKNGVDSRVVTIVSVALGFGYGLGTTSDVLAQLPSWVGYVFGGSGIVPAAVVALVLNIVIPEGADPLAQKKE